MTRFTGRQRVAVFIVLLIALTTAVTSLVGWLRVAGAGLAVLLAMILLLGIDVRRQNQALRRSLTTSVQQVLEAQGQLAQEVGSQAVRLSEVVGASAKQVTGRLGEFRDTVGNEFAQARKNNAAMSAQLRNLAHEPVTQIQALAQLRERFGSTVDSLPLLGGWALDPTTVLFIADHIQLKRPSLVLECGSGSSTVWIAHAMQRAGTGRLVSLEHDSGFASSTTELLRKHGLTNVAEVVHAPLRPVAHSGGSLTWYDPSATEGLSAVELLVIDGPPEGTGKNARYPALPLLRGQLATAATIILDDARRAEERAILDSWQADGLATRVVTHLRGAAVLTAGVRPPADGMA